MWMDQGRELPFLEPSLSPCPPSVHPHKDNAPINPSFLTQYHVGGQPRSPISSRSRSHRHIRLCKHGPIHYPKFHSLRFSRTLPFCLHSTLFPSAYHIRAESLRLV